MRPLLSIVVPTYERAARLERLLAFLAAEAPELPVLVADNASTDGTRDVLVRYGVAHHVHPENCGGVPNARFVLANAPDSDYVWCLADDDLPAPGAIAEVCRLLRVEKPAWLHLPHLWQDDAGRVHLASPCPDAVERFGSSRGLFLAYSHWLTFISASVLATDVVRRVVQEHPTQNEWAPLLWYVRAGLDGPCVVAPRRLVVGTPGTSWEDKKAVVLTRRVVEAYDDTLHLVCSPEEYGRTLDVRYEGGAHLDCWSAVPVEELVAAVERFPTSAQLRRALWARSGAAAAEALDCAARAAGADAEAAARVAHGEERFGAGDVEGAAAAFAEAVSLHPASAEAWNDLGVALHALGRGDARDAFDSALALDPAHADALANRAALA